MIRWPGLLIVLLCGGLVQGEPASGTYNLVFIGDSITAGAGTQDPATQAAPVAAAHDLQQMLGAAANVPFDNQGHSGYTTTDFLPNGGTFVAVESAARKLQSSHPGRLIFSIMLGTNDSANHGPNGAPLSADGYALNLHQIVFQLLADFSDALIVVHHPIWYSPNTHNSSDYTGNAAADRLKSYAAAIDTVIADSASSHTNHVFLGDTAAYDYFSIHFQSELNGESGALGNFWLHPNPTGAQSLGRFWATAIAKVLGLTAAHP